MGLIGKLAGKAATAASSKVKEKVAARGPVEFAFVDVETTGLDARTARIIEIAIVVTDMRGQRIDEWTTLVQPDGPELDAGATRIHLIETDWLRAAPTFAQVIPDILQRFNGRVIVAHNAEFDVDFLETELDVVVRELERHRHQLAARARRHHPGAPLNRDGHDDRPSRARRADQLASRSRRPQRPRSARQRLVHHRSP